MSSEIDYEAVLADLEARRADLEAAIIGIRRILGQTDEPGVSMKASNEPGKPIELEIDAFIGMSVSDAAKKFLRMMGRKPQGTQTICDALVRGGFKSKAKNFYSNVHTALSRDPDFVRVGRGKWGLAEWYPSKRQPKPIRDDNGRTKIVGTEEVEDLVEAVEKGKL